MICITIYVTSLFTDLFEELKKQRESCLIDNGKLFIEEKIAKG